MKKVLMFFPVELNGGYNGGISNIVESYAENSTIFSRNGYDLSLFKGNRHIDAPSGIVRKLMFHINYISRHKKYIKENLEKYDILHIHTSRDIRLFDDLQVALYAKRKCGVPVVITVHRSELEKTITTNKLIQKYFLQMMKKVDKLIFLSDNAKKQFAMRGLTNTDSLSNFHSYTQKAEKMAEKDDKVFRILFVGFFNREKGLLELFQAMRNLPDDVVLDLCGGKKDQESIDVERECIDIRNRVVNHGYVAGKEKENVFRIANVFILPSYGEGMPLVLLEALHFGLPIITTPVGSIPEVLAENVNALFVPPRNVSAIVDAVLKLKNGKSLSTDMCTANAVLSENYCLERNIQQLCMIYDEV